jgi:hypothetical protein
VTSIRENYLTGVKQDGSEIIYISIVDHNYEIL